MPHITQEVWSDRELSIPINRPDRHVTICLDQADGVAESHTVLFQGHGTFPQEVQAERARLAARAPTFFRLLEQVLKLGTVPAALEDVIRSNLHRAAPDLYQAPTSPITSRRSMWEKLLDDDVQV